MSEITDLYEFTLLTGDSDRHFNNYQIEENENGVHLTPYYDFDNIYSLSNYNRLSVEPSNLYLSFEKSLEVYFRFVTKEKRESFRNKLESLTKELIERFLDDIIKNNSKNEEEKNKFLEIKNGILLIHERHRENLFKVLDEYNINKSK